MTGKLGFEKCLADTCLLKRTKSTGTVIVCVYVDDTICVGDRAAIDELKIEIAEYFNIKDEGKMEEYVGCSVSRDKEGRIIMQQPHLLKKIEN